MRRMSEICALTKKIFLILILLWTIGIFLVLFLCRWASRSCGATLSSQTDFLRDVIRMKLNLSLTGMKINFIVLGNYRR